MVGSWILVGYLGQYSQRAMFVAGTSPGLGEYLKCELHWRTTVLQCLLCL